MGKTKKGGFNKKKRTGATRKRSGFTATQNTLGRAVVSGFPSFSRSDPLPVRYNAIMRYSDVFQFSTGVAGVYGVEQSMRLNSLFDPDLTGTGHQPYGYDQMTPLYGRYQVRAVKVTLHWTDPSADGVRVACMLQGNVSVTSLTSQTIGYVDELPFTKCGNINNTGDQKNKMVFYIPLHKALGLSKQAYADDTSNTASVVSGSPSLQAYIRFSAASNRGTSAVTVMCNCTMEYYTVFYDRPVQAQS